MGVLNKDIKDVRIENFYQLFDTVYEDEQIKFIEDEHTFAAVNLLKYAFTEENLKYSLLGISTDNPTKGLQEKLKRLVASTLGTITTCLIKCGCTNHPVLIDTRELFTQTNETISKIGMTVDIENDNDYKYGRCTITINGIPHSKYIFE